MNESGPQAYCYYLLMLFAAFTATAISHQPPAQGPIAAGTAATPGAAKTIGAAQKAAALLLLLFPLPSCGSYSVHSGCAGNID